MKYEYFMVDIDAIEKYNLISNEKENVNSYGILDKIPDRYRKFILCVNKNFINGGNSYDKVMLGECHSNRIFELISNHPFNYKINNNLITLYSATFNSYLKIIQKDNNFKHIKEEDVIEFYDSIKKDNVYSGYLDLMYMLFTNAYDKNRPIIPKKLSLYRDK